MPHTISLPSLTPTEAVADALYRSVMALDLNDESLWSSSWARNPNIVFQMGPQAHTGPEAINALFARLGPMATQHMNSNVRVEIKGEREARLTAYCQNQHFRAGEGMKPGAGNFLGGGTYDIELVKEEGESVWRIQTWKMELLWAQGDMGIVRGE